MRDLKRRGEAARARLMALARADSEAFDAVLEGAPHAAGHSGRRWRRAIRRWRAAELDGGARAARDGGSLPRNCLELAAHGRQVR